ncbi:energy transducer TonB [Alteriqipengyuania sp. 357]
MIGKVTTSLTAAGVLAFAAVFSWPAMAAKEKEPETLQPSSNWHADYSPTSCKLVRIFGEGDDKVVLMMEQHQPAGTFETTVAGSPVEKLRLPSSVEEITYRFGPHEEERETSAFSGTLGEYGLAALFTIGAFGQVTSDALADRDEEYVPPAPVNVFTGKFSAERAARIEWLEIERRRRPLRLATGPMDKALAVMDNCMESLVAEWGVDIAAHRELQRRATPKNNPGLWIRDVDYPRSATKAGRQGIVRFRLIIDERGMPASCAIDGATDPDDFSDLTCEKLMSRAEFEPALDSQGNPIRSYYAGAAHFHMAR